MSVNQATHVVISFGPFEADLQTQELKKHGVRLRLPGQSFQILKMLLQRPGDLVTREELQQALWPSETYVDFDHGVNAAVNRVREALGDSAESPRFIETLPRRGYRFISPVAQSPSDVEKDSVVAGMGRPAGHLTPKWRRLAPLVLGTGIAFLVLGVVGVLVKSRRSTPSPIIHSIAVLPMENLSHDPDQEYFADGMTEALIRNLGKIAALRVISRRSAMHFKGSKATLPEIARQLQVDAVVEGTVERSGNRVRINVDLIQAFPEKYLWTEKYDRELQDVLLLESELAQAIARQIRIMVTQEEKASLASARTVNPEAYEADLKGRYFLNKRNAESFEKAIESFNFAIQKDPGYADPYAMLSQAYALSASYEVLPDGEAWPRAESAALTAVSLDDGLSNAHLASALVVDRAWRWAEAGREFRRAIELNANNADARAKYSNHLSNMGQVEEAIEEAKRAETLDPLSPIIVATVGSRFYYARRYDEAIAQYRKALELEPNFAVAHYDLARAYEQKGRLQEAIAESESAVKLFGRSPLFLGALGHIYATSSKRAEALELVDEMQQPAMKSLTPYFNSAKIYVGLGEKNKAFEQLASAYKEHSIWLATITVDPVFDPLRSDPRFADILRRMGLQQ